ncbi:MAG: hypothetical protein E6G35_08250 [Actinobacteria bacterium]|nr:MAG: hypothetical protein E6G35_08250 [Actinomycetota bacterium]
MTVPVPEAPEPQPEPQPEHPALDAALADLDAAADLDPAEQVPVYEQAYRALSQTLAAIDQS